MDNPLDFEEEIIPFSVEVEGNFYYRYKSGKYDIDTAKQEIHEVLSDALDQFEAFDGDIEIQDVHYNINS